MDSSSARLANLIFSSRQESVLAPVNLSQSMRTRGICASACLLLLSLDVCSTYHLQFSSKVRRAVSCSLSGACLASVIFLTSASPASALAPPTSFNRDFPDELTSSDVFTSQPLNSNRRTSRRLASQITKGKENLLVRERIKEAPLSLTGKDIVTSWLFATGIWFASGSRNNPLIGALGGLLYDEEGENACGPDKHGSGQFIAHN